LVSTLSEHLEHLAVRDEGAHHIVGVSAAGEQIEVADRVATTAERARQFHLHHATHGEDRVAQCVGERPHLGEQHAARVGGRGRERLDDVLLDLLAEAGQVAQAALVGGLRERGARRDAERIEQRADALRPEALQFGEADDLLGYLPSSSSMIAVRPVAVSSRMFCAMPLPMPGSASRAPGSSTSPASACSCASTMRAPSR
jgi:hypothetical protein